MQIRSSWSSPIREWREPVCRFPSTVQEPARRARTAANEEQSRLPVRENGPEGSDEKRRQVIQHPSKEFAREVPRSYQGGRPEIHRHEDRTNHDGDDQAMKHVRGSVERWKGSVASSRIPGSAPAKASGRGSASGRRGGRPGAAHGKHARHLLNPVVRILSQLDVRLDGRRLRQEHHAARRCEPDREPTFEPTADLHES